MSGWAALAKVGEEAWNWYTTRDQRQFNAKQAKIDRDWQEYMSSTAWQRGMKDMKAAGLNPILAASKGGASTPSGSRAQTLQHNSALTGMAMQLAQIENINAQTKLTNAKANSVEPVGEFGKDVGNAWDFFKDVLSDKNISKDVVKEIDDAIENISTGVSTKAKDVGDWFKQKTQNVKDSFKHERRSGKQLEKLEDGRYRYKKHKGKWLDRKTGKTIDVLSG